jgi:uncharacterized membrane protein
MNRQVFGFRGTSVKRTMRRSVFALYVFAIVVGIAARFVRIADRNAIFHDETWSYLNATGHLGEYQRIYDNEEYPVGNWVYAGEWKRLIRPERSFILGQIGDDTARLEDHPPLYFWVLHLWTLLLGADIWTGLLLNVVIDLIILFLLFRFALSCLGDLYEALVVAAVWVLSPISIATSSWIRHYTLFTLITLLFAYMVFKSIYLPDKSRPASARNLMLVMVTVAGLLSHNYFILVILAGIIVVSLKFAIKDRTRLFTLFMCLAAAGALFALVYPNFYVQPLRYAQSYVQPVRYSQGAHDVGPGDLWYRVKRTAYINFFLFSPVLLMLALVAWDHIYAAKTVDLGRFWEALAEFTENSKKQPLVSYILGFAMLISGALILLYLSRVSPQHGMASRYVSIVAPFVAFIPIFVLRLSPQNKKIPLVFCTFVLILGLGGAVIPRIRDFNRNESIVARPDASEVMIIDNLAHGVLPSIVFHLEDGHEVFAASQEYLVAHQHSWLPRLREEGGIYVSIHGHGSTEQGREEILDLLDGDNEVVPVSGMIWELGEFGGASVATYRVIP